MNSDWQWIPRELLTSILDRLFHVSDYVRFSSMCKPWHSVALDQRRSRLQSCHKHVPMLMVPTEDNSEEERSLYCAVEGKVLNQFRLRVPYNKRCSGSSYGWLAFAEDNMAITLLNPFSGDTLRLPPVGKYRNLPDHDDPYKPELKLKKVILLSSPSLDDDYMVAAIYGEYDSLAILRSGNKDWSYLERKKMADLSMFNASDVICYKGQLLVVEGRGETLSIGFNWSSDGTCNYEVVIPRPADEIHSYPRYAYLVESSRGDLLLVQKFLGFEDDDIDETNELVVRKFKVFKMVNDHDSQGQSQWVKLESLDDDDILFVGDNYSTCVSDLNFPGCRTNSIYYTHDHYDPDWFKPHGPHDIGIFDLDDECIYTHYELDPAQKHMPPAVWIFPWFNLSSFGKS